MTKDEFVTQFNTLISSETPDALAIETFRNAVIEDYNSLATAQTAVTSFQSANEALTATNKALQETNMKLIMLHPESITSSSAPNKEKEDDSTEPLTEEQKDEALSKVLEGFGIKKENK